MKTTKIQCRKNVGSTLMMTVCAVMAMGIVLVSYLMLMSQSQKFTHRSQTWNSCIAVAEAGVEEALSHLNENAVAKIGSVKGTNNLNSNGWEFVDDKYHLKRGFGDGYYEVFISQMGLKPIITSTGYLPAPASMAQAGGPMFAVGGGYPAPGVTYVSRTVQAQCRAMGKFAKAILGKDKVNLNGKYVRVDSYNSFDPGASDYDPTNTPWMAGQYVTNKFRDNGDVAVIAGFHDDLNINNAQVWGTVATGPDGDIKMKGNQVSVGSLAWHATGHTGVQQGWSSADANFDIPAVPVPFSAPTATVQTGPITYKFTNVIAGVTNVWTNKYDYVFEDDGDYKVPKLEKNVLIKGKVRIRVAGAIDFDDDPKKDVGIDMWDTTNSYAEIYVEGDHAEFHGKKDKKNHPNSDKLGVNPDGNCTNLFLFGSDKCNRVEVKACDDFHGVIYAPKAVVNIKAGSIKYYHCNFHGAVVGWQVNLEKNVSFHYDENIIRIAVQQYVVESWREL